MSASASVDRVLARIAQGEDVAADCAAERIDAVEIDPSVFHAAPHLDDSNHGVWRDPRFHLVLEDARSYLASTDARYDVISTDCTDLRYKSNANLYTVDYFTLARERLQPGGVVTVWMPLGGLGFRIGSCSSMVAIWGVCCGGHGGA